MPDQTSHNGPGQALSARAARAEDRRAALSLLWAESQESFSMAVGAISAHKLRSSLTLLGVLVGVFSIIVVMTAMRILQNSVETEMSQLGSHTFQISKFPEIYFGGPDGFEKYWRRKNITYQNGQAIANRASLARNVGMQDELWGGEAVSRFEKTPPNVPVFGVTPGVFPARNYALGEGRTINESDLDSARLVCVLGYGLATNLFPFGSAIGEKVKFDNINYTVVGVLEGKGGALGGNSEYFAVIPLTTGLNRYGRQWRSLTLLVQAWDARSLDDTIEQVRGLLRTLRKVPPGKDDDFEISTNDSLVNQFQSFTLSIRIGVAVISSIALVAAGIGIMNIMLVSVTERTREIGIRRALGAKKRNIMTQFVLEAIVLCELGGFLGVALGIAGGNIAAIFLKLPPAIPLDWAAYGLLICSAVGILFGTYPAWKAANLDPIESLRYE